MMKLEISAAFGRTFTFLFANIGNVLRIVWLPIVLQLVAFFLLMPGYVRGTALLAAIGEPDEAANAMAQALPAFGLLGLFIVATFLTSVAMVVGLTRLMLKGEKPSGPFYIGWGGDEWRLAGGWLIFAAIIAGLVIVLQVGGFLLRGVLGPGPQAAIIVLLVNLILLAAIFTVCVRLSLLAPATIATGKISLRESWERTDDDFWNFLGFWLLFALMFAVIYAVLYFTFLLPPGYFASFQGMDPSDRNTLLEAMRKANDVMVRSYDLSDISNVMRLTVGAILGPLGGVITTIAGAATWKIVTDATPPGA
jgi:hypothetical protein